jgi:hypothetical protein
MNVNDMRKTWKEAVMISFKVRIPQHVLGGTGKDHNKFVIFNFRAGNRNWDPQILSKAAKHSTVNFGLKEFDL